MNTYEREVIEPLLAVQQWLKRYAPAYVQRNFEGATRRIVAGWNAELRKADKWVS